MLAGCGWIPEVAIVGPDDCGPQPVTATDGAAQVDAPRGAGVVALAIEAATLETQAIVDATEEALVERGYRVERLQTSQGAARGPHFAFVVTGTLAGVGRSSTILVATTGAREFHRIEWTQLEWDAVAPVILPRAIAEVILDHQSPPPPPDPWVLACEREPEECEAGRRSSRWASQDAGLAWRRGDVVVPLDDDDLARSLSRVERAMLRRRRAEHRTRLDAELLARPRTRARVDVMVFEAIVHGAPVARCTAPPSQLHALAIEVRGADHVAIVDRWGMVVSVPLGALD